MKEYILLSLAILILSLLIWYGMNEYLNPGDPRRWIPAPVSETEEPHDDQSTIATAKNTDVRQSSPPVTAQKTPAKQKPNPTSQKSPPPQRKERKKEVKQVQREKRSDEPTANVESVPKDETRNELLEQSQIALLDETTPATETNDRGDNQGNIEPTEQDKATTPEDIHQVVEKILVGEEHGVTVVGTHSDANCVDQYSPHLSIKVLFRVDSSAIKSSSMTELDTIISAYHACEELTIAVEASAITKKLATSLQRRRLDEVRYHLLHHRVGKSAIVLPDNI